jgi:uncharacterized lipoprotein YmbA
MRSNRRSLLTVLAAAPALFACGTTSPTRFYVLSTIADKPTEAPASVALGVGPINLPQYLDRPQIVTRLSSNQLEVGEFDQWGGQLDDSVARTLAGNLSVLLQTDRVQLFPWKDDDSLDYAVTVDVINFEQDVDGSSVLDVYWSLLEAKTGRVKLRRHATYRDAGGAPITDAQAHGTNGMLSAGNSKRPYDSVVAAMSRNLGALSRDVAKEIQGVA